MRENRLYLGDCEALTRPELMELWLRRLPADRRLRTERLRFDRDRRLSVGAFALLSFALKELGLREMPRIACGEQGKPYFPELPELHFNLSHAGSKVLCGISSCPLGVDVEEVGRAHPAIARRFFSPIEYNALQRCPEEQRALLFTRFWVLRESLLKADGRGLSLDHRSFALDPARDTVRVIPGTAADAPKPLPLFLTEPIRLAEPAPRDGVCLAACFTGAAAELPMTLGVSSGDFLRC